MMCKVFFFLLKKLASACLLLCWTFSEITSGFQSHNGQPYLHFGRGIHDRLHEIIFIFFVTHLPVYISNIVPGQFPHLCVSEELGYSDHLMSLRLIH